MTKSEILSRKYDRALLMIEAAKQLVEEIADADEYGEGGSVGSFMKLADDLIETLDDVAYEIIAPMQMAEEEGETV